MAKTWTVKEAFDAIVANDSSAIADFGKRFPLATCALSRSGENDGLKVLMGAMPDRVTMRILESSLKGGVEESDDDDAEDEAPKKSAKKNEKVEKPKKSAKAKKEAEPDDEDDDETEGDTPDYTKMSAVELYKECKKRGIKVEPKQKSKVYIDALNAADSDSDDDEEDFEDEEDEKPSKKPQKKSAPAKKPSKNDDEDEWDI